MSSSAPSSTTTARTTRGGPPAFSAPPRGSPPPPPRRPLGRFVSTAGDVNGDGFADVVVGAPTYDHGENNEGRAFVFLGSAAGLAAAPPPAAEGGQAAAHFGPG